LAYIFIQRINGAAMYEIWPFDGINGIPWIDPCGGDDFPGP